MRDTLHAKAYRFFDAAPWMLLFIYGYVWAGNSWLATIGFVGLFKGFLVGWEYPPPTVEELERRKRERDESKVRT